MKIKNTNLMYLVLGSFMLVLLQSNVFINTLWFAAQIPIPYLGETIIFLSKILSFIGAIIFILTALKLIYVNFKNKES